MALPQTNITAFTGMNAPTRDDPADFDARAEDAWNRLKAGEPQINTLAGQMNAMATAANTSAGQAAQSVIDANQAKSDAQQARTDAQQARTDAQTAKGQAETARSQAQAAAATLRGTSATALTIGTGQKSLTTETGRQFDAGQTLKLLVSGNGEAWMSGRVVSYNSGTGALVVSITAVATAYAGQGSSTWNLYVSGEVGPTGPMGGLSGGSLTGALNEKRSADVPSAASPDVWSGTGNLVPITGSVMVTNFPPAPQAGAARTLVVINGFILQNNANILVFGGTQNLVPEDEVDLVAITTTYFRAYVRKRDGTPVAHDRGAFHNLRVFGASGVFTATKTGWHKITITGASGSNGVAAGKPGGVAGATGAGAGGFVSGMRFLTAGTTYIVTVAAGATFVQAISDYQSTNGVAVAGNTAGVTQFSGSGIVTLTANGGGAGQATVTPGATIQGGAGGTASGAPGDMTVAGGNGGLVTVGASSSAAASGGGAVSLRGSPFNGGNAVAATNRVAAAGGAGVGGRGGNATATTAIAVSCGGGCAGPAADIVDATGGASQAGYNHRGVNGGGSNPLQNNELDNATGGGGIAGNGSAPPDAPFGGGAGGTTGATGAGGSSGFGGGGGLAELAAQQARTGSAGGQFGGAPGGLAGVCASNGSAFLSLEGRYGTQGVVWIEF